MDQAGFVLDANVLIDFCNADLSILSLAARVLGSIHVPLPVLAKVDQLSHSDCEQAGLIVFEPSTEQLLEAGQGTTRLAFDDRICLIVCRDNHWTCLTNDKALRRACAELSIRIVWGLELMVLLVEARQLPPEEALVVAEQIHSMNQAFVDHTVLDGFRAKIQRFMPDRREKKQEEL